MGPEIIVVGCANVDILVYPASKEVFEKGSYGCEAISMSVGGDAYNEATILSRFGKKVELICTVGKDDAGDYLMKNAIENGIEMKASCQKENLMTSMNVVMIDEEGQRHFLVNQNSSLRKLTRKDVPSLNLSAKILSFASIFVFTDFLEEGLFSLFTEAKEKGMIICADATRCKNRETLKDLKNTLTMIDYFFPNEEEALLFTRESSVEKSAEALWRAGVKNVIVTCGEKGCFVWNDTIRKWYSTTRIAKCIDTTGAGDSFVSGFIKCLSENKDLETCIQFANECGARNVERIGATEWSKECCGLFAYE